MLLVMITLGEIKRVNLFVFSTELFRKEESF